MKDKEKKANRTRKERLKRKKLAATANYSDTLRDKLQIQYS